MAKHSKWLIPHPVTYLGSVDSKVYKQWIKGLNIRMSKNAEKRVIYELN
jgi:hypothetical protein